ncbi:MAG: YHS domain-containing protein [Candidatus Gorgyraea atricola]|nr:YHS domain-containing protein [Candidatus Gorgyraea atricola]
MKKLITLLVVVFVFFVSSSLAFAGCGACGAGSAKSGETGEAINTLCPVMEGEVSKDTQYKTEYNGKTIGFCCPGCIETFNSDPEKYMANIKKECMIKCPECGVDINVLEVCKKAGMSACCF